MHLQNLNSASANRLFMPPIDESSVNGDYFKTLIEKSRDIIIELNLDGIILYVSPSIKTILGYNSKIMIGTSIFDYIHQDHCKKIKILLNQAQNKMKGVSTTRFRFKHIDGQYRVMESNAKTVNFREDETTIIVNSRDITKQKNGQDDNNSILRHLTKVHKIAGIGYWEWNIKKDSLRWSRELCAIYGIEYDLSPSSINEWNTFIHPDDLEKTGSLLDEILIQKSKIKYEHRIRRPDGDEKIILTHAEPIINSRGICDNIVGVSQDITEIRNKKLMLSELNDKLRILAVTKELKLEEERNVIAHLIDDEICQSMAFLKVELNELTDKLMNNFNSFQATDISNDIMRMNKMIDTSINSGIQLTSFLKPAIMDVFGLSEAVEWRCKYFSRMTGISCTFYHDNRVNIPDTNERLSAICRILEEIFPMIKAHSDATEVQVSLIQNNQSILLKVFENGAGLPKDDLPLSYAVGLFSIHERCKNLEGAFYFEIIPSHGTTFSIKVPAKQVGKDVLNVNKFL